MLRYVHEMLDCQSAMYTVDAYGRAAKFFSVPLPFHYKNDLKVLHTLEDLEATLRTLVANYRANGVEQVSWKISAIDIPRQNRFRVWVNWDHIFADWVNKDASQITYFCHLKGEKLCVEMVHFVHTPLDAIGDRPPQYLRYA